MLNIEKVKHMTKAAAYENGPEKKNIGITNYFRTDYLGLQMVKSAVAYTIAFLIFLTIWAMGRMEELMLMISRAEYLKNLIKTISILYIAGLVCYEIAIYVHYGVIYRKAKKSVKGFHAHLKQIHKFYEAQETDEIYWIQGNVADEENAK